MLKAHVENVVLELTRLADRPGVGCREPGHSRSEEAQGSDVLTDRGVLNTVLEDQAVRTISGRHIFEMGRDAVPARPERSHPGPAHEWVSASSVFGQFACLRFAASGLWVRNDFAYAVAAERTICRPDAAVSGLELILCFVGIEHDRCGGSGKLANRRRGRLVNRHIA